MNSLVNAVDLVRTVPFPPLQKWSTGAGETVQPFDLSFTWKVKAADTGFAFSVYEMVIQPDKQIPIHIHPFPEFFYVLDGQIDVMGLDAQGRLTYIPVAAGECANAPATAPHGIKNRSQAPAKFLSVSNYEHQKAFDEYLAFLETPKGRATDDRQRAEYLTTRFAAYKIAFLDARER